MAYSLKCCRQDASNNYFVGLDAECHSPALLCIRHNPHLNNRGIFHGMLPVAQFQQVIADVRWRMEEKVDGLLQTFNRFMQNLVTALRNWQLEKVNEFKTLWLREIAKDSWQYDAMKKIIKRDYEGLSCSNMQLLHSRITNCSLGDLPIQDIQCYRELYAAMQRLNANCALTDLIANKLVMLDGILEHGQILQSVLPERLTTEEDTNIILLESSYPDICLPSGNKCKMLRQSKSFISVYSKYPLIEAVEHFVRIFTKHSNVMLGVCEGKVKKAISERDRHYEAGSVCYNCSNGCLYFDSTFQRSNTSVKGKKQLLLKLKVVNKQLLIMYQQQVIARCSISGLSYPIYLHLLLRGIGDTVEVQRRRRTLLDSQGQAIDNVYASDTESGVYETQLVEEQNIVAPTHEHNDAKYLPDNQSNLNRTNSDYKQQSVVGISIHSSRSRKSIQHCEQNTNLLANQKPNTSVISQVQVVVRDPLPAENLQEKEHQSKGQLFSLFNLLGVTKKRIRFQLDSPEKERI